MGERFDARREAQALGFQAANVLMAEVHEHRLASSHLTTAANHNSWNVRKQFNEGHADKTSVDALVRAGAVHSYPLKDDSAHHRQHPPKFIVLHSTETGAPADAKRVIDSWNNRPGHHHKGAQFVVDCDGSIYMTANPDLWTVHINNKPHKYGVTNENSIGIEIVHSGHQKYTNEQYVALQRLVEYLRDRYKIDMQHIVTHHEVQPANRTDPVKFNVTKFDRDLTEFSRDHKPRTVIV